MAMRPRGGGVGPNRGPAARAVYEDFRPVHERHQDEEAEKLVIYLPGFMKENIRVSTEGKNTVRVRGERFVGGNKWHRFQEDFQAPDDCNMRGIHAKFENGILIITMPWKMPKQLADEHTKQSAPIIPHKDDNVPPRTTHPTVETPRKTTAQRADKDQDSTRNETSKTTYPTTEATPKKPTHLKPTAQLPKPQHDDKDKVSTRNETMGSAESSKTQNGDNVPPKTTYPTTQAAPRKPTPLKPTAQLPKPENTDNDQDSRVKEMKFFDDQLMSPESSKTQMGDEDIDFPALRATTLGKTSGEREKPKDEKKIFEGLVGSIEPKIQKSKEENLDQNRTQLIKSGKDVGKEESHDAGGKIVAEKIKDLREEFQEQVGQKGSKEKESTSNVAAGTSFYTGSISNLKKSIVELNEERQLLVNAGAAVMVIMALGTYVYYSIRSGRTE
ncbi:inactive protein RESTRICTED TEV MOVEMENT 2 [Solanum lycopersicum]|uniref:SHSP domain-containing protein n=1 Tax=Solanum lycopersicum TaxID=4081 RepID=A0A3Q7EM98_SOLLC|nr:protein RESTRICTED TEV MOVEMENT 2 [Solanum lycopersicum]